MRRLWRRFPVGLAVAAVLLLGSFAYLPSLSYPYLQDSITAVATNPVVERGGLVEIFTSDYWKESRWTAGDLYRPVTVASFALERRLTGEANPFVSHLVNLILHQLAALALFFYARRLGARDSIALTAAALFTVHPLLLQGVTNVVGRADVLALLFTLLALLASSHAGGWRGDASPAPGRHRAAVWSAAACLFLALGSKEIAVAAPFLLLIQDALFRAPYRRHALEWWIRRAASLAPCVLAVVVWLALRTNALGVFPALQAVPPEDNVIVLLHLSGVSRVATALGMASRYAGLLIAPVGLSADYSGTEIDSHESFLNAGPLAGLLFLAALAFLALRPFVSKRVREGGVEDAPLLLAMGAWVFLLPYSIVSNLLVLSAAGFAERLVYVPAAGFVLIVATLVHRAGDLTPRARLLSVGLVAAMIVASVVQIREQARMWQSPRDLFERSLRHAPRSSRFNLAMGHLHRREGDLDRARGYFELNTEYAREDPGAWSDLGIFLSGVGDDERAERALRTAIEIDPQRGEAYAHLGKLLRRSGDVEEAERALRKGLLLRPDVVVAAVELGHLLFDQGRYLEAAHYFRGCVRRGRKDLREMLDQAETLALQAAPEG